MSASLKLLLQRLRRFLAPGTQGEATAVGLQIFGRVAGYNRQVADPGPVLEEFAGISRAVCMLQLDS